MPDIALNDLLRSRDPADPRPRRKNLREGIHAHDTTVHIHAQERGDKGFHEFLVGSWGRDVRGIRTGVGLHLQEIIGLVFKDVQIVFLTTAIELTAALYTLCSTRGVLPAGDGIKQKRLLGSSGLFIPGTEDGVEA